MARTINSGIFPDCKIRSVTLLRINLLKGPCRE
jgi:hypothetical protein